VHRRPGRQGARPSESELHRSLRFARGIRRPATGCFLRAESFFNVATQRHRAKWKLREPPSGLKPAAMAMASTSVGLPLPFSSTRKVTSGWKSSVSSARIAGIDQG